MTPDPFEWKEAWVVFDGEKREPLVMEVDGQFKRACLIFPSKEVGEKVVLRLFGLAAPRFPLMKMPRDVRDCLGELQGRLNLDAVMDGETVWAVKSLQ